MDLARFFVDQSARAQCYRDQADGGSWRQTAGRGLWRRFHALIRRKVALEIVTTADPLIADKHLRRRIDSLLLLEGIDLVA